MNDLLTSPIVIRRSKALGFVLVVVTGLPLLLALHQYLYNPAWKPPVGSSFFNGPLEFLLVFLLGVLVLLRPARLTLTTEGLTYERFLWFWRRSWHWQEITAFEWQKIGTGKNTRHSIVFSSGPEQVEVPSYWELPTSTVLALLNQARTTWRGSSSGILEVLSAENPSPALRFPLPGRQAEAITVAPARITARDFWLWLISLALIGVGSGIDYLFGYKDSLFIEGGYMLLIIFGWLGLLFAAVVALPGAAKQQEEWELRPAPFRVRLWRRVKQLAYAMAFLTCLGLLVGNLLVINQQRTQRVARILATEPTMTTLATVIQLRERGSRSGTFRSTVLTYQAGTMLINQALPGIGQYAVGQQLRVKYAVSYPDMFTIVN
ncbi:hypothetical protein [Hymenobacter negativus]|uniref:DUF3592 domain-containing protein n=1 Tax=Hymenobacter negativus TaxID=2795026 RepID=A0ABS3QGA2_9BACT|nr:hypothetical protein [Hymenobacter negativus]MBO2010274.1 hypothetical protein [Hymenobacter negativus]